MEDQQQVIAVIIQDQTQVSQDQNKGEDHHGSDPASTPRPSSRPGPWAGFRSEEELWEFLKTVIPHDDHNKGQNREETDPVTSRYT